jgi:hypothetical protein
LRVELSFSRMGYYDSWRGPGASAAFRKIRADFEKLVLPIADLGCPIAGPDGTGFPEITDNYIQFNGMRDCGHRKVDGPVVLFPTKVRLGHRFVRYYSTDRHDFATKLHSSLTTWAVNAALLIAKHQYGADLKITSCGSDMQWLRRQTDCQRVLGYGDSFRFVPKQRFSDLSGQWIEEEVLEEIPGNQSL